MSQPSEHNDLPTAPESQSDQDTSVDFVGDTCDLEQVRSLVRYFKMAFICTSLNLWSLFTIKLADEIFNEKPDKDATPKDMPGSVDMSQSDTTEGLLYDTQLPSMYGPLVTNPYLVQSSLDDKDIGSAKQETLKVSTSSKYVSFSVHNRV